MNWYLIQTKPNAIMLAQKHLERQGFEVFSPLILKTSRKGSKFINKTVPLFPSYLFIGTKLSIISWKSINATRGVKNAVALDGHYRAIVPEVIESIKFRCDENGILQTMGKIENGDLVKIEKGPFADFVCRVEQITKHERALVLISILKQEIRTKVPTGSLSRVD